MSGSAVIKSEYKEVALICFWYIKLHPICCISKDILQDDMAEFNSINEKLALEKENIVLRFNYNPFLLEEEFDIINSFEEDCMFPTKYIVRNINDVEYVKKIVNRIKK